jgi:hypothetical protein
MLTRAGGRKEELFPVHIPLGRRFPENTNYIISTSLLFRIFCFPPKKKNIRM